MTALAPASDRAEAVRRVQLYNNLTIGWNVVEGIVAIGAGIIAGSISLIAFGLDSGVEVSTSIVFAWRLAQERCGSCMAGYDRRATRWIAGCFAILAVYVSYEAIAQLVEQREPEVSVPGIVIAAVSVVVMPVLPSHSPGSRPSRPSGPGGPAASRTPAAPERWEGHGPDRAQHPEPYDNTPAEHSAASNNAHWICTAPATATSSANILPTVALALGTRRHWSPRGRTGGSYRRRSNGVFWH